MSLFSSTLGAGTNSLLSNKLGGLNMDVAKEAVSGLVNRSGDAMVSVASVVGLLPDQAEMLDYLSVQATEVGLDDACEELINNPLLFGTVWKAINDHDWEEFIVDDDPNVDITPYQRVIETAQTNRKFERAIQAAAEQTFPKLYLLRAIALGITFSDENWFARAKVNTFRVFFLRLALPGNKYDPYIDWYVIITSQKDAWDEMRAGQNSAFGLVIDSIANVASAKMGGVIEKKFESLLADKWAQYIQT